MIFPYLTEWTDASDDSNIIESLSPIPALSASGSESGAGVEAFGTVQSKRTEIARKKATSQYSDTSSAGASTQEMTDPSDDSNFIEMRPSLRASDSGYGAASAGVKAFGTKQSKRTQVARNNATSQYSGSSSAGASKPSDGNHSADQECVSSGKIPTYQSAFLKLY